jgi:hypothetical protein
MLVNKRYWNYLILRIVCTALSETFAGMVLLLKVAVMLRCGAYWSFVYRAG